MAGSGGDGKDGSLRLGVNVPIVAQRATSYKGRESGAMLLIGIPLGGGKQVDLAIDGVHQWHDSAELRGVEVREIVDGHDRRGIGLA